MANSEAKDFYNLASRFHGATAKSAKDWWMDFYEAIVRELYTSGMVYLPKIGWIVLKEMEGYVQKQVLKDGTIRYYEVPERDKPVFQPEDAFIDDINMVGVTKSYRKRVKLGKLTKRDKERTKRALQITGVEYNISEEKIKASKEKRKNEFEDFLHQFKKDFDEQNKDKEVEGNKDNE